jgi:hypothetical protein
MITKNKPIKQLVPKGLEVKYNGTEPDWSGPMPAESRRISLMRGLSWYSYYYGKKEAKDFIIDWLSRREDKRLKSMIKTSDSHDLCQTAWLCRMQLRGFDLSEQEISYINNKINYHIGQSLEKKHTDTTEIVAEIPKPNIQDRLRDIATTAAADIDGMYDDMIDSGAKMSVNFKPISVLRGHNIAPQQISVVKDVWNITLSELEEVLEGKDSQLVEGYSQFTKTQIKNLIKFSEQVIADCDSYIQIKKTERSPRKKKPMSPERVSRSFRYLKHDPELGITSEPVTKLVGAAEAWLYDVKKRKLIHVVADTHIGTFTIKGSSLIGFDPSTSVQKTLRKPAEQLKTLASSSVPNARKFFKEIKATDTKFNGRGNDSLIILRAR